MLHVRQFALLIALLSPAFAWAQLAAASGTRTDPEAANRMTNTKQKNPAFARSASALAEVNAKSKASPNQLGHMVIMDCTAATPEYPCTDAGFATALSVAGNHGTVIIPSGQSVSLTGAHLVLTAISIRCEQGGGFRYPASGGAYIALTSTGGIDGCSFIGQGSRTAQQPLILVGNNEYLTNNTISNFGSSGGSGTVEITGARHIRVIGNVVTNCTDTGIFVNDLTTSQTDSDITISDNQVCNGIIIHATGRQTAIEHFTASENDIYTGENGNAEFGIEIGQFGGTSVRDFSVTGNHIYATHSGTDGGSSLSTVSHFSETGNTFDAEGHTYLIASFEIAVAWNGTVEGNYAFSGTGGDGFTCDRCTRVSFVANTQNGFGINANDYGLHVLVASTTSPLAADDTVEGNTIIFPARGAGSGIWQQCNAPGASCRDITYGRNTIISDGTGGSRCMTFENDAGRSSGIALALNTCKTAAIPYSFGPEVTFSKISESGSMVLSGGIVTVRFSPPFNSIPLIFNATDATTKNPVQANCTATQMTLAGTKRDRSIGQLPFSHEEK